MIQLLLARLMGRLAKSRLLLSAVFVAVGLIGILVLFLFEDFDHNFRDAADYLSWWLGSVTTTGFTAMPETFGGKIWDAVCKVPFFLTGFGFLGAWFAWIIEAMTRTRRGLGTFTGSGHILIIGWNQVTPRLMERYARTLTVVLIDPNLDGTPNERINFFVKGNPTRDATLSRAGVERAVAVIVSLPSDGVTLLTTRSVRRLNPSAKITAVAVDQENVDRLGEVVAVKVLCAVETIASRIVAELHTRKALVFGNGPIARYLKTLKLAGLHFDAGNPGVDADLIEADVSTYPVVIVEPDPEPDYDGNAVLAVSSIRTQAPETFIIVVIEDEENKSHLLQAGADLVFWPTETIAWQNKEEKK